jgi:hypothetical protein
VEGLGPLVLDLEPLDGERLAVGADLVERLAPRRVGLEGVRPRLGERLASAPDVAERLVDLDPGDEPLLGELLLAPEERLEPLEPLLGVAGSQLGVLPGRLARLPRVLLAPAEVLELRLEVALLRRLVGVVVAGRLIALGPGRAPRRPPA